MGVRGFPTCLHYDCSCLYRHEVVVRCMGSQLTIVYITQTPRVIDKNVNKTKQKNTEEWDIWDMAS